MMGAEGIKELLKKIDVEALSLEIRERMKTETSQQKKLKYAKRLRWSRASASPATSRSG